MDRINSGLNPVVGFYISSAEPSSSATRELVIHILILLILYCLQNIVM
jgi:hypothetical protein